LAENWTESNTLLGTIGPHYFIHYKGWKQTYVLIVSMAISIFANSAIRWDEWVPEQRLLKLNEAGFAKRRQLMEAQTKKNRPPPIGGGASPAAGSKGKDKAGKKGEGSRKRARDSGVDTVRSVSNPLWHI